MTGVLYAYLQVAEFLVSKTRLAIGLTQMPTVSSRVETHIISDDPIDSADTPGQSEEEAGSSSLSIPEILESERCRAAQLYLRSDCAHSLSCS